MSSFPYNNQMASFWDFVADLEERGASHPWFGRRGGARGGANRAANRGEAAEGNNTEGPNPWTAGAAAFPFGPMPHRHRHGHGPGRQGGRRHQHNEAATEQKETGVETPETEKVPELKTEKESIESLQSDAEKVESGNEGRRGPGARRGGRGGPGGRAGGVIAARRAFHKEACGGDHLPRFCPKAKELDLFGPAFPPRRAAAAPNAEIPAARRGGPGGRGAGRGVGRGMGPAKGRGGGNVAARRAFHQEVCGGDHRPRTCPRSAELGLFRGPFERNGPAFGQEGSTPGSPRSGGIIPARRAFHKEMCGKDHLPRVCPRATELGLFRGPFERRGSASAPRGGMHGPRGGRGAGFGRGRGAGLAGGQNAAPWARALQQEVGNGPHRGPGAGRGGPGGRGGRGMGAGRGRGGHGPAGRHLNHGLNPAGPHGGLGGPHMRRLAALFQDPTVNTNMNNGKFTPEVDVFDHAEAFVIHASLPGAKKEEIEVNWDSEKSMLTIAGNIERTGDEELLKAVAVNERKVGAFERKIRLGSPTNAAQVDVDDITAKMEDGVLKIEVPKLDNGFVEVKKVDIK